MDEKTFKTQFIATFLASWCAKHYEDACMRGEHDRLMHPPVNDAEHLADCAWEEWCANHA